MDLVLFLSVRGISDLLSRAFGRKHKFYINITSSNIPSNTSLSMLPSDIIQTHILPRLSVTDLASLSCVSPDLRSIVRTAETLWKSIATKMFPSISNPRIQHIISSFPSDHRSFIYDALPYPTSSYPDRRHSRDNQGLSDVIVAVDLFYGGDAIFSTIVDIACTMKLPGELQLHSLKEGSVRDYAPAIDAEGNNIVTQLEKNLTLSWVLIDPVTKRAVNLSSWRCVSFMDLSFLDDKVIFKFSTILNKSSTGGSTNLVECCIMVHVCILNRRVNVTNVTLRLANNDWVVRDGERAGILRAALGGERWRRNLAAENNHGPYLRGLKFRSMFIHD